MHCLQNIFAKCAALIIKLCVVICFYWASFWNFFVLFAVYPQKQQSYGPYGYAAYPGPAAYYGSQYGLPYNQY